MKSLVPAILAGAALTPAACTQAQESVVKVAVMRDGRVEVDGNPVSNLKAALLTAGPGKSILYYREGPEQAPTEAQVSAFMMLMETAAAQDMPIALSPTADFSSFVDAQGRVIPGKGGS